MNNRKPPTPEFLDDVQAGSRGMSFSEAVQTFGSPGEVLMMLRTERGESLETTAKALGVPTMTLAALEANRKQPNMQQVVALAKHLQADLKRLMAAFSLVNEDATDNTESMGIAAKFDGVLDKDEKEELLSLFASVKAKKNSRR